MGVACNGLHTVQPALLPMAADDPGPGAEGDSFPLTHELLAMMLGVRRASISEVLRPLQEQGLIRSQRGRIAILDRDDWKPLLANATDRSRRMFTRLLG